MSSIARRIASLGLYDVDARAWVTAVRAAGASVSQSRAEKVSALIIALKASAIWPGLDRLWIHAAENATQALIDLKARATATAVNSPTFSANKGYSGDGSTSYLDTNFNCSTAGGNYTLNDASLAVWALTNKRDNPGCLIGNNNSSYCRLLDYTLSNYREASINAISTPGAYATSIHTGLIHMNRTGAAASAVYANGVQEQTFTTTTSALNNQTTRILCNISGGGSLAQFSDAQISISLIGSSLSGKEAALYTALSAFISAANITTYDSSTLSWLQSVYAAGGTVSAARRDLVDALIVSLKASGDWALTDDIWLFAAENAAQALVSLKQRRTATAVNAPTFTANLGYTCNGTTSYINTGFVPSTHGSVMTATSFAWGVYERAALAAATGRYSGAYRSSSQSILLNPRYPGDQFFGYANATIGNIGTATTALGLAAIYRSGAIGGIGKNGVLNASMTLSGPGSSLVDLAMCIGCDNAGAGVTEFYASSPGYAVIGGAGIATSLTLYNAMQSLMTSIGANV